MAYKDRIMIAVSIIIAVFVLSYIEIYLLSAPAETEFQIGKFDISESNTSTYSYDIHYNKEYQNITVINIAPEELQEYPVLEKAIIDCAGRIGYYSLCKVSKDDWHKIKDFVDGKRSENTNYVSCFKFGEKYGQTCYQFNFKRP